MKCHCTGAISRGRLGAVPGGGLAGQEGNWSAGSSGSLFSRVRFSVHCKGKAVVWGKTGARHCARDRAEHLSGHRLLPW